MNTTKMSAATSSAPSARATSCPAKSASAATISTIPMRRRRASSPVVPMPADGSGATANPGMRRRGRADLHCRAMRARSLLATLAGSAVLACALPSPAPAQYPGGVVTHMACLAPGDGAGIDAMLERAGSPLAGDGATFVTAASRAGIDPRALVAIAAHETMLETYG